jgi:hypothetical protein
VASIPSPISFRAGGWCIHPFRQLKDLFLQNNIGIDSSVTVPFFRTPYFYKGKIAKPDPSLRSKSAWRFSSDPLIAEESGAFLEIPIDTMFVSLPELWKTRSGGPPVPWRSRGTFVPGPPVLEKALVRFQKLMRFGEYRMLSLDVTDAASAYSQFERHVRRSGSDKSYVFISHPKQFGPESAAMLDRLVSSRQFRFSGLGDHGAMLGA